MFLPFGLSCGAGGRFLPVGCASCRSLGYGRACSACHTGSGQAPGVASHEGQRRTQWGHGGGECAGTCGAEPWRSTGDSHEEIGVEDGEEHEEEEEWEGEVDDEEGGAEAEGEEWKVRRNERRTRLVRRKRQERRALGSRGL